MTLHEHPLLFLLSVCLNTLLCIFTLCFIMYLFVFISCVDACFSNCKCTVWLYVNYVSLIIEEDLIICLDSESIKKT